MQILCPLRARLIRAAVLAWAGTGLSVAGFGQLIYQEGFNDDGSTATPPRYTIIDGMKFEPPFPPDLSVAGIPADQLGPVYWAHSFEVSIVGVPGPTQGRRAALAWDGAIEDWAVTADTWKLIEGVVKWLAHDRANATVLFTPSQASAQSMADHLAAIGYTIIDDDENADESSFTTDVVIRATGGVNVSRFAQSTKGVLVFSALDHDDMLTGSIGSTASFVAGPGTIANDHPAAGGLTGTFNVIAEDAGPHTWNLLGDTLPTGSITVATFQQEVPPTAATLADVDAMVAGTKPSNQETAAVAEVDFADGSFGEYFVDHPIPGGFTAPFGLVIKGKLNVSAAGTYSFAVASDDGARLRIDVDQNGLSASDDVIVNDVAQGHTPRYGDATFAAAGLYDFEVTMFNSGGAGDVEFSVSTQDNGGDTSEILSGSWELLGQTFSAKVSLEGEATATSYQPSGEAEFQTLPLLVINNGPSDIPPGNVFGGGAFDGFEGTGYFAGSAINKPTDPGFSLADDFGSYRALQLRPVDVTGQTDVKITVALAATFLDFETSDRLDIWAYPDGESSTPVRLARYSAPSDPVKYFVDIDNGNINRLGLTFQDVTYDAPADSRQLIIEFRAFSSWWNETLAFDNVRISAGAVTQDLGPVSATLEGDDIELSWTGGTPPYLVQGKLDLEDPAWIDLQTVETTSASIPLAAPGGVFRIQDSATKTVRLFKASLNGANERPTPNDQPGTGIGLLALEGLNATYVVSYENLSTTPHLFHLHGLGGPEEAVGVKFSLVPAGTLGTSGLFVGSSAVDQATADGIVQGLTYFNIHTPGTYSGGEIRGQVLLVP